MKEEAALWDQHRETSYRSPHTRNFCFALTGKVMGRSFSSGPPTVPNGNSEFRILAFKPHQAEPS